MITNVSPIFALAVAATLGVTWASRSPILQKVGLLLMAAWATSNFAVEYFGFLKAPLLVPSIDGLIAVVIAATGYRSRSNAALVIFLLYGVVGVAHVMAFILQMQDTYTYYAVLNVIFGVQLLVLGATGAWLAIRHWAPRGAERFSHDLPRWIGLAR